MKDVAVIIGVFFLFFSIFVFEAWRKGGEEKGKDAAQGVFFAIWVLIAFGFGSWAISWLFVNAGNLADVIAKSLNINVGWLLFSPLIIVFIFGLITNFRNKTKPPSSPFH
jgi:predicted permease